MGECDDDLFFADVACSAVYTSPVSPSSTYCNPGQTGVYCLMINNGTTESRYGITCTNGAVSGKMCRGSCGTSGPTSLSCPPDLALRPTAGPYPGGSTASTRRAPPHRVG